VILTCHYPTSLLQSTNFILQSSPNGGNTCTISSAPSSYTTTWLHLPWGGFQENPQCPNSTSLEVVKEALPAANFGEPTVSYCKQNRKLQENGWRKTPTSYSKAMETMTKKPRRNSQDNQAALKTGKTHTCRGLVHIIIQSVFLRPSSESRLRTYLHKQHTRSVIASCTSSQFATRYQTNRLQPF
jgi:hypothetical protein